jgi:hypothetical protein
MRSNEENRYRHFGIRSQIRYPAIKARLKPIVTGFEGGNQMSVHIPADLQLWIDARKRFQLSHAQVQMARELGLNPKKLGGLANHDQEPWKLPLPQYIERLYFKRFGKEIPETGISMEDRARQIAAKKQARQKVKRDRRLQAATDQEQTTS